MRSDGVAAADTILGWASDQRCADVPGFRRDMCALVDTMCRVRRAPVDIDVVLKVRRCELSR